MRTQLINCLNCIHKAATSTKVTVMAVFWFIQIRASKYLGRSCLRCYKVQNLLLVISLRRTLIVIILLCVQHVFYNTSRYLFFVNSAIIQILCCMTNIIEHLESFTKLNKCFSFKPKIHSQTPVHQGQLVSVSLTCRLEELGIELSTFWLLSALLNMQPQSCSSVREM